MPILENHVVPCSLVLPFITFVPLLVYNTLLHFYTLYSTLESSTSISLSLSLSIFCSLLASDFSLVLISFILNFNLWWVFLFKYPNSQLVCVRKSNQPANTMMQKSACLRNLIRSSGFVSLSKIGAYYTSRAASSLQEACEPSAYSSGSDDEYSDIDWNNLGFGLRPTDYIYMTKCSADGIFEQGQLNRYGNIELNPSAGVLNYGQGLFEGTKAFRRENGRLFLFRPDQNAIRMQSGADRLCMPSLSTDQFIDAVKQTALANRRWIPPPGKGSLYIRPLLIGSGPILGLAPAPEYTFLVYCSPVGNYFKEGLSPLSLYIEDEFHRATRGGVGGVKSITNYAPVLKALTRAKSRGFSDVIYLDSVHKKNLEEATSCNVFVVKGNLIATPPTTGNILPGVTRKTVIDVARDHGYQVEERIVSVDELLDGDEVFCTGTAVGVVPVGNVTYQGKRVDYKAEGRLVSWDLYSTLLGIQSGDIEDKKGWFLEIE